MVLYTLAGSVSSVAVGYGLGVMGGWVLPTVPAMVVVVLVGTVAALAAARELDWLRFPLPQPRRQTRDAWAKHLGLLPAAVLWGLDIGATLNTRFTYAGTWAILLLPVLAADPVLGATTLLAAWLGRAASVWVVPPLIPARLGALDVLDAIAARHRLFRNTHVTGLLLVIAYAVWSTV